MPALELVITQNYQIIKTVKTEMCFQGSHAVKYLQEFQQLVNDAFTNLIEERGGNEDDIGDLRKDSSDDEEDAIPVTPKKRRQ